MDIKVSHIGNTGRKKEHPVYNVFTDGTEIPYTVTPGLSRATHIHEWFKDGKRNRATVKCSLSITSWLIGIVAGWNAAKSTKS